jgi:Ca-activated chloride channel family protein
MEALLALLAAIVLAVPCATAGEPEAQETKPEPVLDLRYAQVEKVQLVLIPANVTDGRGHPVAGLRIEDFRLTVDGEPRKIEFFATESNAPVALAFLLDLSGSMRQPGKLQPAKDAIRSFVDLLGRNDRFGLIGFADHQVTWITEFTGDAATFKKRLDVQEGFGQTALYDALAASPRLVEEGVQARKAMILFTDGLDNASAMTPLVAVQVARQVSVPIYPISFLQAPADLLSPENRDALLLLERFSRETGGKPFRIQRPEELRSAMASIQNDLRLQYVLGFQPAARTGSAAFKRIILETNRSRLHVRCRTGYYADF